MINQKYYEDIKHFPEQFQHGLEMLADLKVEGSFNKAVLTGMGGSSSFVELVNDILASVGFAFRVTVNRNYVLPNFVDENTLIINSSYSGNTEEVLYCYDESLRRELKQCVFTTGGQLLEKAKKNDTPMFLIPSGIQPRLSTGYFISGLIKLLVNCEIIEADILSLMEDISIEIDEEYTKELAKKLVGKVPIIYSSAINSSIARVVKIKFNENSKTQSFWNTFPELNHNEMEGFTKLVMQPAFLIFKSQFAHDRNLKRIEVYSQIMREKDNFVEVIEMRGESVFEELLYAHYLADHISYYLAEEYQVDPEFPAGIEEFKKML